MPAETLVERPADAPAKAPVETIVRMPAKVAVGAPAEGMAVVATAKRAVEAVEEAVMGAPTKVATKVAVGAPTTVVLVRCRGSAHRLMPSIRRPSAASLLALCSPVADGFCPRT